MLKILKTVVFSFFAIFILVSLYGDIRNYYDGPDESVTATIAAVTISTPMEYELCVTTSQFGANMKEFTGILLASGPTDAGVVSVISFTDGSFGLFIYREPLGIVCLIDMGNIDLSVLGAPA
jgi:hypothetical protein